MVGVTFSAGWEGRASMGNAVVQPCTSDPQSGGDSTTFCAMRYSKSVESLPEEVRKAG